ncbi:hypothetical protein [Williamsoniiplasma lucivorax]|uniref:Uncharacterized protein n=1 Tax=Williamsoniiplasma lucivorax TaxID=209274 RepID=A0A2S5RD90_9MOLU|nr:hypothetical protein [Williamsoniiplasma lucivorax]PPE05283.1 hypothetical protein ELUCI_v1c08190 [Williamsoniiplasma lucivorax]
MKLQRFIASFLNTALVLVNIVLLLIEMPLLGEMIVNVPLPEGRRKKVLFGLITFACFFFIIPWIINIVFWFQEEASVPTRIFNKFVK